MSVYDDVALLQQQMTEAQANITALQTAVAAMQTTDIAADTDLNTLTAAGCYCIPSATVSATLLNKPTTSTATGEIIISKGGDAGQLIMKYIICNKTNPSYYQRCYYSDGWGEWQEVNLCATEWADLPLQDGITAYSEEQKPRYKRVGNEVFISGVLKGMTATDQNIATLPSGFRPSKKVIFACPSIGQIISKVTVDTDGTIRLNRQTIEPIIETHWLSIACSFSN